MLSACMLVKMVVGCPWSEWLTRRMLGKQQVRALRVLRVNSDDIVLKLYDFIMLFYVP